ncbi:MAG: hypothetical protein ACI8XM_000233 [Haloarculaceae archaeon]|jgi:hypothetical protein
MSDDYQCHVEGCDWSGDSKPGLRSHVSGVKDADHQEARNNKAWEGWHPVAFGVVDPDEAEGSDGSSGDPDEATQSTPDEPTDGERDATPDDGGTDPADEYEEQWAEESDDADDRETTDEPADDSGDDTPGDGGSDPGDSGVGAAMSLVAGTAVVGLLYVLTSKDGEEREVREVEAEDVEDVEPSEDGGETFGDEGNSPWGDTIE